MAIITCPECGKEISDKATTCIHCGYPLGKHNSNKGNNENDGKLCPECGEIVDSKARACPKCKYPFSNKKSFVIDKNILQNIKVLFFSGVVLITLVLSIVIAGTLGGNKYGKAKKFYNNNDLKSFLEMKKDMSPNDISKFSKLLIAEVDNIRKDYVSEKITYETAIDALENVLSYSNTSHLTNYVDSKSFINDLQKSRDAYEEASSKEKEGDYQSAYDNYAKVIEQDENYTLAQGKMDEMRSSLCQEYITNGKEYAGKEDYSNAIASLNRAKKYDDNNSEIDELLEKYKQSQEEIRKKAEEEARAKAMMEVGKVISTNNMTTTFVSAELTDHIYPDSRSGYYHYYSVSQTGITWIDLKFRVKNSGSGILNLNTMVQDVCATYDTNLEYKTYGLYYSSGSNIDRVYEYFDNSIEPLQEVTLHLIIEMPVEAKTSGKPLEVEVTLDGEKQILIYQ